MPAVDDYGRPIKVKRKPRQQPRTVRITTPDQIDRRRAAQRPATPDQQDRNRSPAQKSADTVAIATNIKVSRRKFVSERASQRTQALVTLGTKKVEPKYQPKRAGLERDADGTLRVVDREAWLKSGGYDFFAAQKRSRQQRAERLAPAISILGQLARPTHASAAGARAAIKGENPLPAAKRGFQLKDKSTYSDVLGDLGVENKYVKGIGGFTLDVLTDPTTYVSFGAASVARKAAEKEARKATQKALKAGASKKAADKAGRAAAKKVLDKETNRGLTVGFAGKRTSGRTTAKVSRALRIPQASDKARGSLPGRLTRHVAPSVKPAGVDQEDFLRVRDAMVRGRAIASRGEKGVRNRAQAIARILPGDKHSNITDALEALGQAPSVSAALRIPVVKTTVRDEPLTLAQQKSVARQQRKGQARPPARVKVNPDDAFSTRALPVEKTGGTPRLEPQEAEWFHGTPAKFEGTPSAKGQWSDLGVYLTTDPHYARGYADAAGMGTGTRGNIVPLRVEPKKVLDWRAGRESPAELKRVVDAMIEKERAAHAARRGEVLKSGGVHYPAESAMGKELQRWSEALGKGQPLTAEASRGLQQVLQEASESIGSALGRKGTGNRHQILAETLRGLGYDAIRKVDQWADALVVLDEKIMRRVTGREGVPGSRRKVERSESAIEVPGDRGPHPAESVLRNLTDDERKVVDALRHDYDAMYRAEHARGLVGAKFREFGYSPRRVDLELQAEGPLKRRRMGGAQLESSKARTNRKPYAAFRGTDDDIYTENAAVAYYLRGRDSFVKQGRKEVIDALHNVGRRWHPGAKLNEGDEIYRFSGRQMPVKVEGDELKSLMRGGAPPGLSEYRVLHRNLVEVAEDGIPEGGGKLDEIGRIWDRQIQGRVKTLLTVVNPQYHMTNLYGDLFNAYKAAPVASIARNLGVSAQALAYRARREAASKTLSKQVDPSSRGVKIDGKRMTLDELLKEAEQNGAINQGFIGRDLAEVLDRQGKEAAQRLGQGRIARRTGRVGRRIATSRAGSKIAHPIETIRDASQYREDGVRLALYLVRRRKGDTPSEAARYTNRHLLDYGDLTHFEKSVLRRVFPFYTWTARNTPQQIRALIERPGKYANLEKLRIEAQKASDLPEDYEGDLEKYEQQGVPIPIPGTSKLLYPKLPVTDLNRLTVKDQGNFLMAMLSPVIRNPVELDQNYSFFLRRKIDELVGEKGPEGETVEQLKPAPPVVLAAIKKMPGPIRRQVMESLRLTPYTDKRTGKKVVGWPAKVDYVWRSTPATTFAGQAGAQIPNTRGQSPQQAAVGYLTGLKVVPYRPTEVEKKEAGEKYGYLQAKAKSMRDRGTAYNKNGTRTSAYQKVLDEAREAYRVIDPSKPKVSPEASAESEKLLRGIGAGGGSGQTVDQDEIDKLLRGIGAQ